LTDLLLLRPDFLLIDDFVLYLFLIPYGDGRPWEPAAPAVAISDLGETA
jgi:hypothetical protein